MTNRPTPETDAIEQGMFGQDAKLIADFARRLERERSDLLDRLTALEHSMPIELAKLERERDEAREEIDELNKRLIEVSQLGVDLLIEREDLRKELAAERALADRLAQWMVDTRTGWLRQQTNPECDCDDCKFLRPLDELIHAWKEARK